jgi:plastocyanin
MSRRFLFWLGGPALFAFISCGGSSHSSTPTAPAPPGNSPGSTMTIQVGDDFFNPQSVTVQPGTTVQWTLVGSMTNHTVTSGLVGSPDGAFDSGMALTNAGATFMHTFTAADSGKTFNYFCQSHGACCGMKGSIKVGANAPPPSPGY